MRLADKVAVITGAGSGIGLAMARLFVDEGAHVLAADVVARGLEQLEGHARIATVVADVASSSDVDRMISAAVERFGRLDILCNNAGVMDRFLPAAETTDEVWERVLAVNLTGPFLASRRAIPIMLQAGGGVIINTASVSSYYGARAGAAYTASKHGVIGLTRNIAATYGRSGIRCVAICPAAVKTGMPRGGEPSALGMETHDRTSPARVRRAEPDELAKVALFLASDEASIVNGAVIVADGGWTAH